MSLGSRQYCKNCFGYSCNPLNLYYIHLCLHQLLFTKSRKIFFILFLLFDKAPFEMDPKLHTTTTVLVIVCSYVNISIETLYDYRSWTPPLNGSSTIDINPTQWKTGRAQHKQRCIEHDNGPRSNVINPRKSDLFCRKEISSKKYNRAISRQSVSYHSILRIGEKFTFLEFFESNVKHRFRIKCNYDNDKHNSSVYIN